MPLLLFVVKPPQARELAVLRYAGPLGRDLERPPLLSHPTHVTLLPDGTVVVSIPIDAGEGMRTERERTVWEQLSLAALLQRYWADNQVSATVTFSQEEASSGQVAHALDYFQYQLKGVSFLPRDNNGAYTQMPYEEVTEEEYLEMMKNCQPSKIDFSERYQAMPAGDAMYPDSPDKFCETDQCAITPLMKAE